jgi:hypothetical protein
MKHFIFYLTIALIFFSCITESCPPDEFIGTITMSDVSKELLPYEDVLGLVFKNNLSEEIRLNSLEGLNDSFIVNCVYKPCSIPLVDENCKNVDIESRGIVFENDSIKIIIRVFWELPNESEMELDTSFIETIETVFNLNSEQLYRTHFLSNSRGVSLGSDYLDLLSVEILDQLTLGNCTFSDVYTKDELIWFSKSLGLVGFRLGDELFVLKEVIK